MSTPKLTVLITGSNQGLGFETARQLSKLEYLHIYVSGRNGMRVKEAMDKIVSEEGCNASIDSVVIDVTQDESIEAGVQYVEGKLRGAGLDVLVVSDLSRSFHLHYASS